MNRLRHHIVRKASVATLIAVLLASTTGFSVHVLYCLCKGEVALSLLSHKGGDCCHEKKTAPQKTASCCKKAVASCETAPAGTHPKKCMHHGRQFVKLDAKYFFPHCDDLSQLPVATLPPAPPRPAGIPCVVEGTFDTTHLLRDNNKPPPRPAGPALLHWLQTFRC